MSGLYFDAWAAATPNGTSLGELTQAYGKSYRGVHQGMGFGQFTINRHDAQAAWAATGNLIRVRRVTGGPFAYDSANYIGEFWIEGGDDKLLSKDEEGGEDLTRGGRTGEACLEGAVLYPDAFDSRNDKFTTKTRIDGNWHIDDRTAGEVLAIFLRDLNERTPDPLSFISKDFGVALDTNDVSWTDTDTKWQIPVGINGLQLLETCVSGGLYYRVSPDFTFHAYETEPGVDLTATVVITKGTNLTEGAERQVYARTTISRALVQGTKESGKLKYREVVNSTVESALPRRREGFVEFRRTPTNNKLDKAGNRYISKMKRRHDGATSARVVETTGQEAFTDYVPGDLVTLDIPGIYEAVSTRVYAIVLEEDEAGNVDPVIEFEQSPFDPATNRDGDFEEGKGGNGSNGGTNCGDCPPIPPYVPDLQAPEVQWISLQSDSNPGFTLFTVDASDDGAAWSTIASGAALATGVGDAAGAGPVPGVVQVGTLHHRYWRISFTQPANFDFASGTGALIFALLSNGTSAAVCRLGTLWNGPTELWYSRKLIGVTTDPNYVATCDWPHLYGGGLTNQSTITAQPSDGAYGAKNAAESGAWSRLATWVFDIGVDSDVFGGPLEGQEHAEETGGDGTTTAFTTNYPYAPGSLEVHVNGVLWPVTETDPTAGTFTFASAPPLDAVIIIRYQNAGTTATGATNTIPVASTPPTVASLALDDLIDVNAPTPADGEVLTWDDYLGQWEPAAGEPTADAHIADTTDAHDASAVSVLDTAANFTGTDVEAVLAELAAGGSASTSWFDVTAYGATGDGVTDDTTAVQAAITACMTALGGIVYFPKGVYLIGGALQSTSTYNSQLTIPQRLVSGSNPPVVIEFRGEGPQGQWNHGTSGAWDPGTATGSIILSNWTGAISGEPAVIAAGKSDAVYPAASFNWIETIWTDIEVRCPADPKLSGIQMAATASIQMRNVTVSTNTDSAAMTAPANTNASGIVGPLINNANPPYLFDNVFVDGFYTGMALAEVSHLGEVSVHHCVIGIAMAGPQNHAVSAERILFVAVKTGIKITGGAIYLNIANLHIEHSIGSGTFQRVYDFDDAGNYGSGFVFFHTVQAGVGADDDCSVNGGTGIQFVSIDSGTLGGAPSGAAGGDLSGTYPNPSVTDDSHSHTAATLPAATAGEILISDTPSTPLVFADLLQNEAQDGLVYAD